MAQDFGALVVEEVPTALVGGFFDALLHPLDDSAQRALMNVVPFGQLSIVVARELLVNLSVQLAELPVVVLGDDEGLAAPVICEPICHVAGDQIGFLGGNVLA